MLHRACGRSTGERRSVMTDQRKAGVTRQSGGEPVRLGDLLPTIPPAVAEALALEVEDAREAGAIGYMARILVRATMPHSRRVCPGDNLLTCTLSTHKRSRSLR